MGYRARVQQPVNRVAKDQVGLLQRSAQHLPPVLLAPAAFPQQADQRGRYVDPLPAIDALGFPYLDDTTALGEGFGY